jgi:nucleotide-binding universal stress UspA family protein
VIERILLAVDDSPDALAAARVGVELAAALGARLHIVHVAVDHQIDAMLQSGTEQPGLAARREMSATSVLTRIADLASMRRVPATTALLQGEVADAVLDEAREWAADLVIVGRSFRSGSGEPYVGALTRHILEFATRPVLVVPPRRGGGPLGRT